MMLRNGQTLVQLKKLQTPLKSQRMLSPLISSFKRSSKLATQQSEKKGIKLLKNFEGLLVIVLCLMHLLLEQEL